MNSFIYNKKTAKFIAESCSDNLDRPLLINWNIIGACCNRCTYCYGYDIRNYEAAFHEKEVDTIIAHLKEMRPIVVVITGGEPLLCDNIFYIIEKISAFANVILDTNGLLLTEEALLKLKENDTHLRISLDSDNPNINESIRVSSIANSTEKIKALIRLCVRHNLDFTVQTVVSSVNAETLPSLFSFLNAEGVKNWRLLDVVTDRDTKELSPSKEILESLNKTVKGFASAAPDMFITYTDEKETKGNNIILINPKGQYLYRPAKENKKYFVSPEHPESPTLNQLLQKLDMKAHIKRYVYFKEEGL